MIAVLGIILVLVLSTISLNIYQSIIGDVSSIYSQFTISNSLNPILDEIQYCPGCKNP
jgi:hypothetical protein